LSLLKYPVHLYKRMIHAEILVAKNMSRSAFIYSFLGLEE